MKIFVILIAMMPMQLWCEDVTEIAEEISQPDAWYTGLITAAILIISGFISKFLYDKSSESKKKAESIDLENESIASELKHEFLDRRLIPFLYEAGAHIADTKLPCLLADAININDGFDWKKHLADIKDELKDLAIDKFKAEGIDLISQYGEKYINSLVDRAINKAMPFIPSVIRPKTVVNEDITGAISNTILEKGLSFVRKQWLS